MDRYWGGDPEMATDNPYADLDGDGVPELAIGRLTAHTAEELTTMLKKIFAYEDSQDFGPWRTRINFIAGAGGYGAMTDTAIETFAQGHHVGPAGIISDVDDQLCLEFPLLPGTAAAARLLSGTDERGLPVLGLYGPRLAAHFTMGQLPRRQHADFAV